MQSNNVRRTAGFAVVGAIGFLVDASILTLMSRGVGVDLYLSRVLSFAAATILTWILNRSLVFKVKSTLISKSKSEYGRYLLVQIGGALMNLAVFALVIEFYPLLHEFPVAPLAVGAIFGLMFNYLGSRHWVFKKSTLDI